MCRVAAACHLAGRGAAAAESRPGKPRRNLILARSILTRPWRDPLDVLLACSAEPWCFGLLSDGGPDGGWSYVGARPERTLLAGATEADPLSRCAAWLEPERPAAGPPFQGGVVGIAAYDLGARFEPAMPQAADPDWPALVAALYPAILAFDHGERQVYALGRGADAAEADRRAARALAWLAAPAAAAPESGALAAGFAREAPRARYERAVADVVERIRAGEIFQANIADIWSGTLLPGRKPVDLLARLAGASPAPFAAYHAMPDRALVSNSPERFLAVDPAGGVVTQPIKGTRPRGATPAEDARLAAELAASAKDRAENLMIVDLMRNDLARVSRPGSVRVPALCAVRSFANVHHLVSTVQSRLAPGRDAADLLRACFPPGSITGAPKIQAMRVIAGHERPRGPFFGSSFWLGHDGALDSNVLIRSVALHRRGDAWHWEARAGAGIVADSDPAAEAAETEAKISRIRDALLGAGAA